MVTTEIPTISKGALLKLTHTVLGDDYYNQVMHSMHIHDLLNTYTATMEKYWTLFRKDSQQLRQIVTSLSILALITKQNDEYVAAIERYLDKLNHY